MQRQQVPAAAPVTPFAFAPARETEGAAEPLVLPELPDNPHALGQEVLADPHMRPTVLQALEAFARAARPGA